MGRWGRFVLAITGISAACSAPYAAEDPIREVGRAEPRGARDGSEPADASPGLTDADDVDDASADVVAEPKPPRCDRAKPFSAPVFIDSINSADGDADARLSADESTLYFTSERGTVGTSRRHRLWTASRVGTKFVFTGLTLKDDFGDAAVYDPTVSPDGLTIVIQHSQTAAEGHLRVATRTTPSGSFGPFIPVPELDAPSVTERDPYFTADGTLLFTQNGKIARALRFNNSWASALAPEVGDLAGVRNPVLSADGLEIFYSSADAAAPGNMRIHRAQRASTSEKFGAGSQATELGGTKTYEAPTWLSADGCHLLLSSDRAGQLDIYYAVRGK